MNRIVLHPRAKKFLQKITKRELSQIVQKLKTLRQNPFSRQLDIKKLETKTNYRLRVRSFRIIYSFYPENKIIYVEEIDFRGSVYN